MASKAGRFLANNSCLFICDIQEKFQNVIQYFGPIAQVSSRLLDASQHLDIPVFVTEQYPKGLGKTAAEVGLSKYPSLVALEKTQFSMCQPSIMKNLSEKKIKNVFICGIEAHVCVQGTCLELLDNGFNVHVIVDACSSRSMVDRMYAFERMKAAGAWLTTSESVILGLVGDSSHPKFKDLQKLILKTAPDSGLLNTKKAD